MVAKQGAHFSYKCVALSLFGITAVLFLALVGSGGNAALPQHYANSVDETLPQVTLKTVPQRCRPASVTKHLSKESRSTKRTLIRNATLWVGDATKRVIRNATLELTNGRIAYAGDGDGWAIGKVDEEIDARGAIVTAALVDVHSHAGLSTWPALGAVTEDENESSQPLTPQMRAIDAFDSSDRALDAIRNVGGVASMQVLPGSANVVGGQGIVVKLRPGRRLTSELLLSSDAPIPLKMACGENPKRVYGQRRAQMPVTRMGVAWLMRQQLQSARQLHLRQQEWCTEAVASHNNTHYNAAQHSTRFPNDISLEALLLLFDRAGTRDKSQVLLNVHCYLPVDMESVLRIADEFNVTVDTFHHALGAHHLAKQLKERDISVATFADQWGYKRESYVDVSLQLISTLREHDVDVALKSDHPVIPSQRLVDEAAKAFHYRQFGTDQQQAMAAVTSVPARMLGLDDRIGSLEMGKDADVVLWDGHPLRYGARPTHVWIEGELASTQEMRKEARAPEQHTLNVQQFSVHYHKKDDTESALCNGTVFESGTYIIREFDLIDTTIVESALARNKSVRYAHCEAGIVDSVLECLHCAAIPDNAENVEKFSQRCFFEHPDYRSAVEFSFATEQRPVATVGLVAVANHLGQLDIEAEAATRDDARQTEQHCHSALDCGQQRSHVQAAYGLHLNNHHTHAAIDAGITTSVAAPRSSTGVVDGQSVAFSVAERVPEYAFVKHPASLHVTLDNLANSRSVQLSRLEELFKDAVRRNEKDEAGGKDALQRVVRGELLLSVHADRAEDLHSLLRLKRRFGFDLTVIGGADVALIADELASTDTNVILSPLRCVPDRWESRRCNWTENVRALRRAAIHFGVASDDPAQLRQLRWEARTLIDEGLAMEEALATVTQHVSAAFRLPASTGSVVKNSRANLVLFSGQNPLSIESRVVLVVSGRNAHCSPTFK